MKRTTTTQPLSVLSPAELVERRRGLELQRSHAEAQIDRAEDRGQPWLSANGHAQLAAIDDQVRRIDARLCALAGREAVPA